MEKMIETTKVSEILSDSYFLSIQNDIDLRNAKLNLKDEINSIKTYKYV